MLLWEGQQPQGRPAHHLVLQNFKTNEAAAVSAHMNRDSFVCMRTALLLFCWLICTASNAIERSFTQKNKQSCCPLGTRPRLPPSPHLVLTVAMEQYQLPKHSSSTELVCQYIGRRATASHGCQVIAMHRTGCSHLSRECGTRTLAKHCQGDTWSSQDSGAAGLLQICIGVVQACKTLLMFLRLVPCVTLHPSR